MAPTTAPARPRVSTTGSSPKQPAAKKKTVRKRATTDPASRLSTKREAGEETTVPAEEGKEAVLSSKEDAETKVPSEVESETNDPSEEADDADGDQEQGQQARPPAVDAESGPEKGSTDDSKPVSRKSRSRTSSGSGSAMLSGKKELAAAFKKAVGAGAKMDRRLFDKCIKAADFVDKEFTSADINAIFVKSAGGTAGKLDFDSFKACVEAVAAKKRLAPDTANSKMVAALLAQAEPGKDAKGGALRRSQSAGASGPARLFYDTSKYTGVHKKGGPKIADDHIHQDLSKMVRPKSAGPVKSKEKKASPERPAEALNVPGVGQQGPERFFYDKSTYTGMHATGKDDMSNRKPVKKGLGKTNPNRGPEKLFYDKSTYTGTAANIASETGKTEKTRKRSISARAKGSVKGPPP